MIYRFIKKIIKSNELLYYIFKLNRSKESIIITLFIFSCYLHKLFFVLNVHYVIYFTYYVCCKTVKEIKFPKNIRLMTIFVRKTQIYYFLWNCIF